MAIVRYEQVIKVLRQYNPWWRTTSAIKEESKPQKRLAYYEVLKVLKHTILKLVDVENILFIYKSIYPLEGTRYMTLRRTESERRK